MIFESRGRGTAVFGRRCHFAQLSFRPIAELKLTIDFLKISPTGWDIEASLEDIGRSVSVVV